MFDVHVDVYHRQAPYRVLSAEERDVLAKSEVSHPSIPIISDSGTAKLHSTCPTAQK